MTEFSPGMEKASEITFFTHILHLTTQNFHFLIYKTDKLSHLLCGFKINKQHTVLSRVILNQFLSKFSDDKMFMMRNFSFIGKDKISDLEDLTIAMVW